MTIKSTVSIIYFQIAYLLVGYSHDVKLISWNLRDFGNSRDYSEIRAISEVLRHADVVAIEEAVAIDPGGAQAVGRLVDELDRSGEDWEYIISDPTNSPSHYISERYAFLWKSSKAKLLGKAKLLSEVDEVVHREPFVARFKIKNSIITMINYHSRTNKNGADDESLEINAISNYLTRANIDNVIWSGDFNLEIGHEAFKAIKSTGYQNCLNGEKTTLKKKCNSGKYLSNAEDNILYSLKDYTSSEPKVLDFVGSINCMRVKELQLIYSDHFPIQVSINQK